MTQELLKLPQHMLVQDSVTWWGSTVCMLQHLIEQQTAISVEGKESKDRRLMLESGDWEVVKMLVDLFNKPPQLWEQLDIPHTLSTVKPLLCKLYLPRR